MAAFLLFLTKWIAFFRPKKGWAQRLRAFRAGQTVWPVPYSDQVPKLVPWPIDWIPHRPLNETDSEEDKARGFVFLPCVCVDTGREAKIGDAVLCLRCGVPLHPIAANMVSSVDPPYCRRCSWPVFFAGR